MKCWTMSWLCPAEQVRQGFRGRWDRRTYRALSILTQGKARRLRAEPVAGPGSVSFFLRQQRLARGDPMFA